MASVAVIFGGMAGFVAAALALIAFDAGWIFALGLWFCTGTAAALGLIALAMSARQPKLQLQTENA